MVKNAEHGEDAKIEDAAVNGDIVDFQMPTVVPNVKVVHAKIVHLS
jgi:hypothetical protein